MSQFKIIIVFNNAVSRIWLRKLKFMNIVCLGWGSLIWAPGSLPIEGDWKTDGPFLPIEFARTSQDGRLTLVIAEGSKNVETLWVKLNSPDLTSAVEALRQRENIGATSAEKFIGSLEISSIPNAPIQKTIWNWLKSKNLDAAVWTNLPSKFNGQNGVMPTELQAIEYIRVLKDGQLASAREYIQSAPQQIATNYRMALEDIFKKND